MVTYHGNNHNLGCDDVCGDGESYDTGQQGQLREELHDDDDDDDDGFMMWAFDLICQFRIP